MKTKIIYISGNEVFDMRDIRAAFDQVRAALNLGGDTVMFGVPVDADDAIAGLGDVTNFDAPATEPVIVDDIPDVTATPIMDDNVSTAPESIISDETQTPVADDTVVTQASIVADEVVTAEPIADETVAAPAPKKRRGGRRPRVIASDDAPAAAPVAPVADTDSVASAASPVPDTPMDDGAADEKIIPILSVLAAKTESVVDADMPVDDVLVASLDDGDDADIAPDEPVIDDASAPIDTPVDDRNSVIAEMDEITDTQQVTIEDMISDDAPIPDAEKTLEQLLEKMTPLREDHPDDMASDVADDAAMDIDNASDPADETDATLARLATEFAASEDMLPPAQPVQAGKIGKLKNILPFKKAKREDTGLMGDLFGWAGIAANDDDFSIPGFFTGAASKN